MKNRSPQGDSFGNKAAGTPALGFLSSLLLLLLVSLLIRTPALTYAEQDLAQESKDREGATSFSFLTWGRVLLSTEQFSQAASYLEKEVETRPESGEGFMLLGKAYWGMGRIKDARATWEKAASLEPGYVPLVNARLARLNRLQNLLIVSNEINAEEAVTPFLVRDVLSGYFSRLGFNISPKLSGEFLARLTSSLEALAPPALDEIRKITNADILILSEAASYFEFQDFKEKGVKVAARLSAKAIDLHRHSKSGSYQMLRTANAPTLLEASEKALKEGAERIAREILQQIVSRERLRPSLVLDKADIVIPKASIPQGSKIPVAVTIHNEGDEEAKNLEVRVQEVSPDNQIKPIESFLVASLPPLASVTFNLQWEALSPGPQKIAVSAQSEDSKPKAVESHQYMAQQEVLVLSEREILVSLYRMAFNYTPVGSAERALLSAQLRVALNPADEDALEELLGLAVDADGSFISVMGLGLRPWNVFSDEVASPMAKRTAREDAQNWVALARKALGKTPHEGAIPTRLQAYGAQILMERAMPDGSVLLKMHAPLE
jgi:tetratricopeptide (TPR) repeat protein